MKNGWKVLVRIMEKNRETWEKIKAAGDDMKEFVLVAVEVFGELKRVEYKDHEKE